MAEAIRKPPQRLAGEGGSDAIRLIGCSLVCATFMCAQTLSQDEQLSLQKALSEAGNSPREFVAGDRKSSEAVSQFAPSRRTGTRAGKGQPST